MSYGMDGWNHDNDLVRRKDVMDSLVKEYNRRFSLGERNGLHLAWIEKAVNEVDVAQQGKIQLPEEDATKSATSDLISREAAIDDLHGKDPSQIWDTADIEVWVNALPPAQPERIRGRWIEIALSHHTYKCSVCGRLLVNITDGKNNVAKNYPYCHCGADMRGEQDG